MSAPDVLGLLGSTVDQIRFDACVEVGGVGVVYRGRHLGRNETVAIKCLRISRLANASDSARASIPQRLQEETRLRQRLSPGSPGLVGALSSGQLFAPATGEPVPYIVLEWFEGQPLPIELAERRDRGLPGRTLTETLDLVESVMLSIAHAHTQGVIFGDITPSKLVLARAGDGQRLKLLDVGLTRILAEEQGIALASNLYAAPEQLSSQIGEVGPWTDIYSLTVVMLEIMRGDVTPSRSERTSTVGLALPAAVAELFARAVAQDPLERPANAGVFWSAVRELAAQRTAHAALASTTYDTNVAEAMAKVREAAAALGGTTKATQPETSPWTGTVMMVKKPSGKLERFEPPPPKVPTTTAPLAMPVAMPAPQATSPLAASFGPGVPSPVAKAPPGSVPSALVPAPAPEPPPALAPAAPLAPAPRTSSIPPAVPSQGNGFLIAILALLVLAVAAAAGLLWLRRPS